MACQPHSRSTRENLQGEAWGSLILPYARAPTEWSRGGASQKSIKMLNRAR